MGHGARKLTLMAEVDLDEANILAQEPLLRVTYHVDNPVAQSRSRQPKFLARGLDRRIGRFLIFECSPWFLRWAFSVCKDALHLD